MQEICINPLATKYHGRKNIFLHHELKPCIDLSADVGGNMGLFVGASIISLTEILELCVDLLVLKLTSIGHATTVQNPDQHTTKVVPLE